jgi:hypothetical protein
VTARRRDAQENLMNHPSWHVRGAIFRLFIWIWDNVRDEYALKKAVGRPHPRV